MRQTLSIFVVVLSLIFGTSAHAQLSLSARINNSGRFINSSLRSETDLNSCAVSLFASFNRAALNSGEITASAIFHQNISGSRAQFVMRNLRSLRGVPNARTAIYFRASSDCVGTVTQSNIAKVQIPLKSRGSLNRQAWIQQLPSHLTLLQVKLTSAFPNLEFNEAIALADPNDGTNRLFLVQQDGKIYSFDNSEGVGSAQLYLDISSKISSGGELGLLGIALHPDFVSSGKFYINYTEPDPDNSGLNRSVIARYLQDSENPQIADPNSEKRVLVLNQPFSNHNGGDLAFGPDSFLYIGFGDGGGGGDPQGNGQNRRTLLGKMLRINVDKASSGKEYSIPKSNPFRGNRSGYKEEIYAYGFRNPFRFSFDFATKRLWVADVGQGEREEVDIVERGRNYGWGRMEGSQCYPPGSKCSRRGLTLPVDQYTHAVGQAIIGGFVYRGSAIPALVGKYVFGDFASGLLFSSDLDGTKANHETLLDSGKLISSFGQDAQHNIYLLSYSDGLIYRLDAAQ